MITKETRIKRMSEGERKLRALRNLRFAASKTRKPIMSMDEFVTILNGINQNKISKGNEIN